MEQVFGEAVSLKNKDVNLSSKSLTIKDSKNGKDRLVPISNSLALVCMDYIEHRSKLPVMDLNLDDNHFLSHSMEGTADVMLFIVGSERCLFLQTCPSQVIGKAP